jgi:indolepyruvate ferredoxin oxidoreductase alpha subunit
MWVGVRCRLLDGTPEYGRLILLVASKSMAEATKTGKESRLRVLLGDEAVALGAMHAGISNAYAYPGTPSTEITEFLIRQAKVSGEFRAAWSANEKSAFEEALGASLVGRRALVSMKHVGLNVAADPFMNASVVAINGGVVLAVADDPGMHSSQNEQDSRYFADFARAICLEPATQQEAYEMTREGFDLSERFQIPVMVRLVTRLAHSRAPVAVAEGLAQKPLRRPGQHDSWILLPSIARREWQRKLDEAAAVMEYMESCPHNQLALGSESRLGVITTGLARSYYLEAVASLEAPPSHLHIGAYPMPVAKIRELCAAVETVLVLEEGYPFVERYLRGILQQPIEIQGRLSGEVPEAGELNTDLVRHALGLSERPHGEAPVLPTRPPQLCHGCPHADSFAAVRQALSSFDQALVTSDIGCYTLGALPPYNAIDSCVCMGASVSMAKGAAEAGAYPVIGVIGDSTFLHTGVQPLMDAVAGSTDMTLVILDNETTGMTGGQPTILPSSRIESVVLGLGIAAEHCRVVDAHPKKVDAMAVVLREEIDYHGPSVVIAVRECIETARRSKKR